MYLYSVRVEHKTRKRASLYMIPFVSYRDAPFAGLVRLKGGGVHTIVLFDRARQRSASRGPCSHIDAVMTSSYMLIIRLYPVEIFLSASKVTFTVTVD